MTNMPTKTKDQAPAATPDPVMQWKVAVQDIARRSVLQILSGEKAKVASGRIMLALSAAQSLNPAIMDCTPDSVARCVAMAAMTGIMPGGFAPKAYLVPKSPGQGKPKELNYWVSHRGILDFARRAGWTVTTSLVSIHDEFSIDDDVIHHKPNPDKVPHIDFSAKPQPINELRGIIVRAFPIDNPLAKVSRWVNLQQLDERRAKSDTKDSKWSPWNVWPLEMYEKTALKYCASRGLFDLDDAAEYSDEDGGQQRVMDAMKASGGSTGTGGAPQQLGHQERPQTSSFADVADAVGTPSPAPASSARTITIDPEDEGYSDSKESTVTHPPRGG